MYAQNPKRPGAGQSNSKVSGGLNGVRVGNSPAVDVDIDSAASKQRHTSQGDEAITSDNFPVREHGTGAKTVGDGGQFEFQGTPTESSHLQRERISKREEVKDAEVKSLSDRRFKNEKEQRKVGKGEDGGNPRGQR